MSNNIGDELYVEDYIAMFDNPAVPDEMTAAEYLAMQRKTHKERNGRKANGGKASPPGLTESDKKKSERTLEEQLSLDGAPAFVREYRFHPVRNWRFDFAWPDHKLALEVDGGIWMQTEESGYSKGHAHPVRFLQDQEKFNEAVLLGWRVLHVSPDAVFDFSALVLLRRAFEQFSS